MNSQIFQHFRWYHILFIGLIFVILFIWYKNSHNNKSAIPEQFEETPKSNTGNEIVLYYTSWCGYSRQFLPEWQKFEEYAKNNLKNLKVTTIACESGNENLCTQKGIEGFPTVVLYPKNGTEITFDKERKMEKIIDFVKEEIGV